MISTLAWTAEAGSSGNNALATSAIDNGWETVGQPLGRGDAASLTVDSAGAPVVAWSEFEETEDVRVRRYQNGVWEDLGKVNSRGDALFPSIAVDDHDAPVVAVEEGGSTLFRIYVRRWDGRGWIQIGDSLSISPNSTADHPCLAVGSDGSPVVAWHQYDGITTHVYVAGWNGAAWSEIGEGLGSWAWASSLVLDDGDRPVVAWVELHSFDQRKIVVQRWDGSTWQALGAPLSATPDGDAFNPSLAFGSAGLALAWNEFDPSTKGFRIFVYEWVDNQWRQAGSSLSVASGVALNPSLRIGAHGSKVVSWEQYDGTMYNIQMASWIGDHWVTFPGANALSSDAFSPSIGLARDSTAFVAFEQTDSLSAEIYVRKTQPLPVLVSDLARAVSP